MATADRDGRRRGGWRAEDGASLEAYGTGPLLSADGAEDGAELVRSSRPYRRRIEITEVGLTFQRFDDVEHSDIGAVESHWLLMKGRAHR